jgi:ABC-type Na+ efflux pump permease subunit
MLLGSVLGFEPDVLGDVPLLVPPLWTLALVLGLTAPLAVLTSAILLGVSAFARSFREAQTYFLPITLGALALTALAVSPHATLSSVVAVVPIANAALAVREAIEGRLLPLPLAVAFLSSAFYAWAALRKAATLLEREDLVLGLEPPSLLADATAEGRSRRAIISASCFRAFAASWRRRRLIAGLAVTLGVRPGAGVAYPRS